MGLLDRILAALGPRSHPASGAPFAADPRTVPIGMYTGNPPLPMTPSALLVDELLESMQGEPGLRQSLSTARNTRYYGTDVVPAPRFPLTGPVKVNRDYQLEVAATQAEPPRVPDFSPPGI